MCIFYRVRNNVSQRKLAVMENSLLPSTATASTNKTGPGRPKIYTDEEARERRLVIQKRIREERKQKLGDWRAKASEEQKQLVRYLTDNIYDGEVLAKIKSLVETINESNQ